MRTDNMDRDGESTPVVYLLTLSEPLLVIAYHDIHALMLWMASTVWLLPFPCQGHAERM